MKCHPVLVNVLNIIKLYSYEHAILLFLIGILNLNAEYRFMHECLYLRAPTHNWKLPNSIYLLHCIVIIHVCFCLHSKCNEYVWMVVQFWYLYSDKQHEPNWAELNWTDFGYVNANFRKFTPINFSFNSISHLLYSNILLLNLLPKIHLGYSLHWE